MKSIMIAPLQEVDAVLQHPVNQPVFLRQAAGPDTLGEMLERLGLADTGEGIAQDGLHQV